MTERLDQLDSDLVSFRARVLRSTPAEGTAGGTVVVLDRTAFHPEGGGQPCDHGTLGGGRVVGVSEREGEVLHVVLGGFVAAGAEVAGEVDGARRLDHMQQHSGQHLLSAALKRLFGRRTLSFHMGAERSTIDVDGGPLPGAALAAAEEECARIIREDRAVTISLHADRRALPEALRGQPAARPGPLRVVTIAEYDAAPCGGTHVDRTGRIEAVHLLGAERLRAGTTRVEFLCGGRVRRDHRHKTGVARALTRRLSIEEARLEEGVTRALERLAQAERAARAARKRTVELEAGRLLAGAERVAATRLLGCLVKEDAAGAAAEVPGGAPGAVLTLARDEIDALCQELLKAGDVAALVVVAGTRGRALLIAPAGGGFSARELLAELMQGAGGRGGGHDRLAQGGWDASAVALAGERLLAHGVDLVRQRLGAPPAAGCGRSADLP